MQSPLMGVIEGGGEGGERRVSRAWAVVAQGYRAALSELCPSDEYYELMRECLRNAQLLAGQPLLSLSRSAPLDRATG